MATPSGGASLEQKKGLAYAKLFSQQQLFAAKQATLFARVSGGDEKAIDDILNDKTATELPHKGEEGENGDATGKRKRKKREKRDPNKPK